MKTAIKEINRKLQNEGIDFKINRSEERRVGKEC